MFLLWDLILGIRIYEKHKRSIVGLLGKVFSFRIVSTPHGEPNNVAETVVKKENKHSSWLIICKQKSHSYGNFLNNKKYIVRKSSIFHIKVAGAHTYKKGGTEFILEKEKDKNIQSWNSHKKHHSQEKVLLIHDHACNLWFDRKWFAKSSHDISMVRN